MSPAAWEQFKDAHQPHKDNGEITTLRLSIRRRKDNKWFWVNGAPVYNGNSVTNNSNNSYDILDLVQLNQKKLWLPAPVEIRFSPYSNLSCHVTLLRTLLSFLGCHLSRGFFCVGKTFGKFSPILVGNLPALIQSATMPPLARASLTLVHTWLFQLGQCICLVTCLGPKWSSPLHYLNVNNWLCNVRSLDRKAVILALQDWVTA